MKTLLILQKILKKKKLMKRIQKKKKKRLKIIKNIIFSLTQIQIIIILQKIIE